MKAEYLTRQLDIIPLECLSTPHTIIGGGAIGGWVALCLAKMGCQKITVIDFDGVSEENISSQFYRISDIGLPKVVALQSLVEEFSGTRIDARREKYESGNFSGIVISAVDNMAVRKAIWTNHLRSRSTQAVIDPRMGAETALLYVMNPNDPEDIEAYGHTLYDDSSAVAERCTAKATIYTANLLGGLVTRACKELLTSHGNYSRIIQWDIRSNSYRAYTKGGKYGA